MHIVVAGGFTESAGSLERITEAAVRMGLGHDGEDTAFPLREALGKKNEDFKKSIRGAHVITHSAGALALLNAEGAAVVSLVAPPEPRTVSRLAMSAVRKTKNHLVGRTENPRLDHLKVSAGNTYELTAHFLGNIRHLGRISHTSTVSLLAEDRIQAGAIGYFPQAQDEFFGGLVPLSIVRLGGLADTIRELPGRHDQLLVAPANTLELMQTAYAAADLTAA